MIELLEWISCRPRTYAEVMDAWRSTCPRHSVWEDALADRLVHVLNAKGQSMHESRVALTERGQAILDGLH